MWRGGVRQPTPKGSRPLDKGQDLAAWGPPPAPPRPPAPPHVRTHLFVGIGADPHVQEVAHPAHVVGPAGQPKSLGGLAQPQ